MRSACTSILIGLFCAAIATATACAAQEPPPPPPPDGAQPPHLDQRQLGEAGRMTPDVGQSLVTLFFPKVSPPDSDSGKEIAGLPAGSHPELLSWERVYTFALLHARTGAVRSVTALEPNAVAELAAQHGVADFGGFRRDFLASGSGAEKSFRDPSRDYLELLRRLQVIDNGRVDAILRVNCLTLFRELLRGESSGLTQLQVDLVDASIVRARQRSATEIERFRDALDRFKAELGFSPHALLIPDRQGMAAFGEVFQAVHTWPRNPKRTLDVLPKLIARLPALGEVVIEGRPILGTIEASPERLEEALAAAARVASKNRGGAEKAHAAQGTDVEIELRVRERIRRLLEAHHAYGGEKRCYELAMRLIDQGLIELVAPPSGGTQALAQSTNAAKATAALLEQLAQVQRAEDRLVGIWASFKAERLALYRDLGILPYDDWRSFYNDLAARPND
jgi:hypothetical protein